MLTTEPGDRLSIGGAALATISTLLSVLPLHIYSLHASGLGNVYLGDGSNPVRVFSVDAQMVHGYLFSTVLLLIPIVLLGRRWPVPFAVPTLLVAVPAVLMHLMFGTGDPWWLAITVAVAAAGTEVVLRVGGRLVHWPAEARWIALGLLAPPLVWGSVFVAGAAEDAVGWNVHMVSGVLTLAAITGLITVLITRNVHFGVAPRTDAAPAERTGAPVS
jgi:hypothetical protein